MIAALARNRNRSGWREREELEVNGSRVSNCLILSVDFRRQNIPAFTSSLRYQKTVRGVETFQHS